MPSTRWRSPLDALRLFVGISVLTVQFIGLPASFLLDSDPPVWVFAVVPAIALLISVWYWRSEWSIRALWDFLYVFLALGLLLSVVGFAVERVLRPAVSTTESSLPVAVFATLALLAAVAYRLTDGGDNNVLENGDALTALDIG